MDDHVGWQVELAVMPGALEAFRELTAEMVAATRGEPNVLIYERFVSADGSPSTSTSGIQTQRPRWRIYARLEEYSADASQPL